MKSTTLFVLSLAIASAPVSNLAFSETLDVAPPPAWAVGMANRSPRLDALPGFRKPPLGFGTVPFFWWLGDPLTKERLAWILQQMEGMGVSGYQINYAHSDKGGRSYGLTYPSDPALFSDEWWKLVGWFMAQAKKQGAGVSLSDYTLGFGQGWFVDDLLREHPEVAGMQLQMDNEGRIAPERVAWSLDPMHPMSGRWYAEKFFGQFERHFPGEGGKGLNFFFSDELGFGVSGRIWSPRFAEEFKKRKGYDIMPELAALFKDIGPRTPKIRLDYNDVLVALSEEGFFKPVFEWHQQRGMTMGCDHGGRGRDVLEFGDYFRTQRWNQGPGADQPNLGKDLIKAKVAASIAHLYERPRVWLEGFYGSGWGTTSAGVVDALFANYVMGYNLFGIHGMYYSTHGGWWEWAPPDNTFRMPYWRHLRGFMGCVQRLSYVLSQGHHRCDVAILYPVAPMEAGMDGPQAVEAAFSTGSRLYAKGVDFDFTDFESLNRAKIVGRELQVSGEIYRVLVLPAMRAARHSTLQKALEFRRAGGIVVAIGALPEASDRVGADDPEVAAIVKELFPDGPTKDLLSVLPNRDYEGPGYIQHRKLGPRDLYAVYNAPENAECFFRASGRVELWDPWTGGTRELTVLSQNENGTRLKLPLSEKEIQLVVFQPGKPRVSATAPEAPVKLVDVEGDWEFELHPTCDNRFGDFHWPPTPTRLGAEVRQLWYCEGENTNRPWSRVTCSFGPQFEESTTLTPGTGKRFEFSWRWGLEHDAGHQGYHGLKEEVHDDFMAIGRPKNNGGHMPDVFSYEPNGEHTFFRSAVVAPHEMIAYTASGPIKPDEFRLNGELVQGEELRLKAGPNPLVLRYSKPGRTYFVVCSDKDPGCGPAGPSESIPRPLAMRWWKNPKVLPFDVRANEEKPVGWYRFVAPPGLRSMRLNARGKVSAWANGKPLRDEGGGTYTLVSGSRTPATVLIRMEQQRGYYGGAALEDPIVLECGTGQIALGDWSKNEGLQCYSGGAWYRKDVVLPRAKEVKLALGEVVASAEVRVNGQLAGIKVSPPWKLDITRFARAGTNRIEVLVCNTLANHYTTVPTRYGGNAISGLLGPVRFELK